MYDVYSKFDVDEHVTHFINYCEVIILESGDIEYAVPSHVKFLERIGTEKFGPEFTETCPQSMWADYLTWLVNETGAVCCWSQGYRPPKNKELTENQVKSLSVLVDRGLVKNKRM